MLRILLAALCLAPAVARGQIVVVPEAPKLGQKTILKILGHEGHAATWTLPEGAEVVPWNPGEWLFFPGRGGSLDVSCTVPATFKDILVLVPDPDAPDDPAKWKREKLSIPLTLAQQHQATVKISGGGPALPDDPAGPLAAHVPDAKRYLYADYYRQLAIAVRTGKVTTTGKFRQVQAAGAAVLKAAAQLGDAPALNKPISDRIAAAIGLEDGPLDAAKTTALASALDAISADF